MRNEHLRGTKTQRVGRGNAERFLICIPTHLKLFKNGQTFLSAGGHMIKKQQHTREFSYFLNTAI